MKRILFSQKHCWMLGFVILVGLFAIDSVWSQEGRSRQRGRRGDPSSFLRVIRDDQFAATLNLTTEQKEQLEKLRMEGMGLREKIQNREELAQAMKELDERAVNLLNDGQKAIWQKRKEEILAEQTKADGASSEKPATTEASAKPATANASSSSGVASPERSQPAIRGSIPDEKPPEGAITVISFGPVADAKAKEAEVKEKEEEKVATIKADGTAREEATLSFNFRYAAWADVLKLFAEVNDLSLDLNDVPPGTFNYIDKQKYTMTEALDVVNGYLLSKGYVLVRRDRFLVCLNIIDNPIPPNVVPNVTEDELLQRGKNELLSLVLPLDGLDAEKMVTDVEQLLGPHGKATALKGTNSLILTGIGSNLRRVNQLLKFGKPIDNRETAFRAIPMKFVSAADAERIVRRHFGLNPVVTTTPAPTMGPFGGRGFGGGGFGGFGGFGGGFGGRGQGGGGDNGGGGSPQGQNAAPATTSTSSSTQSPFAGKIQVTADTRGNFLLVTASSALIKVVEELVKNLDTDTDSTGGRVQVKNSPVYFQGYSVPGNDATAMSRMLNNIIPGVVVGEDTRAGKIYVQGTKEEHTEIQRLIKASTDATGTTSVFQLMKLDPSQVANSLRNLFVNDAPRAPTIEADANGRKILVRGTSEQLNQVRLLLKDLGETTAGGTDANGDQIPEADRGTIRRLNLGSHDPEEILDLVRNTWGAAGHSPIRIVIPSKPSPIRDRRIPSSASPIDDLKSESLDPAQPRRNAPVKSDNRNSDNTQPDIRGLDRRNDADKPRNANPATKTRSATTRIFPRPAKVVQTSQIFIDEAKQSEEDRDEDPVRDVAVNLQQEVSLVQNAGEKPVDSAPTAPNKSRPSEDSTKNAPEEPIGVTIMGNDLILSSPDKKSLDQLEDMLTAMIAAIPPRTRWTVFYLRSADATESAQMIEKLFPQSSVTTTATGNDSFLGGFAGGFSSLGRSMMNVTGLNQTLGGGQTLKVITDVRSNALFVTGPKDTIRDIEYVLELLDSNDVPGSMRDRFPRTIPVEYADVDEVAEIIESVFKDSMTPDASQQGNQNFNPLAAMFGGGNRGGAGNQQAKKPQSVELSLGVDKRTSHLIVSCNETMFRRIESMVQDLDLRAKDARRTVRLVPLKTADPTVVASTLTSLMPRVTVGTTRPKSSKKQGEAATPGQPQQNQSPDGTRDAQMIQRMMQQNNGQFNGGRQGTGGGRQGGGGPGGPGQGGGSNQGGGGRGTRNRNN